MALLFFAEPKSGREKMNNSEESIGWRATSPPDDGLCFFAFF
jgi:hypothetical protein